MGDDEVTRRVRRPANVRGQREAAPPFREGRYLAPDGSILDVREDEPGSWSWTSRDGSRVRGGTLSLRIWEGLVPIPASVDPTTEH